VLEININISNYEEYLLSAVDGELSGDEMVALEAFLEQYPHIREELVLLKSVRLTPDHEISFDDKAQLYRQATVLSAANYESQLLDYIDNELHGPEKQALELLIKQHPHIRQELNILKQARLQPDLSLRFGDKTVLYRNHRTKVRPIWWWSAVAAVVAGAAVILFAPSLQPGNDKSMPIAVNQPAVKKNTPVVAPPVASNTPVVNESAVTTPKAAIAPKQKAGNSLAANIPAPAADLNDKSTPTTDNNSIGLTKLAQPVATSGEIVQQLQDKINEQQVTAEIEKAPVMANAVTTNKVSEAVTAAAPVQGELVVSVTMNGDSKLLNGVANVARFFSKKKK
jgi:hypothetical protein